MSNKTLSFSKLFSVLARLVLAVQYCTVPSGSGNHDGNIWQIFLPSRAMNRPPRVSRHGRRDDPDSHNSFRLPTTPTDFPPSPYGVVGVHTPSSSSAPMRVTPTGKETWKALTYNTAPRGSDLESLKEGRQPPERQRSARLGPPARIDPTEER